MRSKYLVSLPALFLACAGFAQTGTMSTYAGLNTVQYRINASATPDPTIAVGTRQYCEHVNSGYQCWDKVTNQPVNLFGNTNAKSDSVPWTQNGNNSGNTTHCGAAYTPNSQLLHDNVYNLWILEKRIHYAATGHDYLCVAISNIEDIAQTSPVSFNWFAMEYDLDRVIPQNALGHYYYPDYPQAGLWQSSTSSTPPYTAANDQAMWITYDLQDVDNHSNINGVLLCAVDLAGLRGSSYSPWVNNSKTPACAVAHTLSTYNQRRSWVPAHNSDTTPPLAADGEMFTYMIEPPKDGRTYLTDPAHTQGVEQWTIDWSQASPIPTQVNSWDLPSTQAGGDQLGCFNVANYYGTSCIPQPSTSTTGVYVDSVADRMQQFFHYTSNQGQSSSWTSSHVIQIVPNKTSFTQTEAVVRVLQRNTATPFAVYIAGEYQLTDPSDPTAYVFLPSIVRDKAGNLQGILGVSGPGANQHPGLQSLNFTPGTLSSGTYGYIINPATAGDAKGVDSLNYRWGDWYSAVLDPSDSCTVWVVGEYLAADRTATPYWYTQIAKLPPMTNCASSGPAVFLSTTSVNFGNQQVGVTSAPQVITLTNSQSISLSISSITTSGDFAQTNTCGASLAANSSCTISVTFTPTTSGSRSGMLTVNDNAANTPQTASLSGTGLTSSLSISPSSIGYGNQIVNTTSSGSTVTITNNGFVNVTLNSIVASGNYSETDSCTGVVLVPGQNCTATVKFAPTVVATVPGALTINDTAAGSPHVVTLSGTGIVAVSITSSLTFAAQNVGTTSPGQTATITNNQSSTLNFTWSTSGTYSAVGSGTSPCGASLASKAKCTLSVTFTPQTNGIIKGALTVAHDAGGSPAITGLSGTGQNGPNGTLTFSPTSLGFGNVALGTSSAKTVTIKNPSASSVNLTSITTSGQYTVAGSGTTPCGASLAAGKNCTVIVTFTPVATSSVTGAMTVVNTSSTATQVLNLSGTGVTPVTLSPSSIGFGSVAVGTTSAVQTATITNNQTTAVPITSIVASGQFLSTTGGSIPCGSSVPASSICTVGVQFSPATTGTISGVLTFSYSGSASPAVMSLSGIGQ